MASETIKRVRLGEVFDLQMGKTPARADSSFWGGGHKWISIADIGKADVYISETKETISDAAISASGIRPIPKDTLIMSFKLSIGKVAITAEEMFSNEAIMSFRDLGKHELDLHYLFHQFKNKDWSGGMNKAVMGATLNKASLKCHEILLHPLPAQRRIAAALDKISEMKRNAEARLQKLDLLVKARFSEMFERGVASMPPLRCDISSHDKYPVVAVGEVFQVGGPKRIHQSEWQDHGVPFLRISDLSERLDGNKRSAEHFISRDRYDQLKAQGQTPVAGDVLVTARGTLGRCYVVEENDEFYFQDGMITWLSHRSEKLDLAYFLNAMKSESFKRQYEGKMPGSTVAYLSIAQLAKLKLPLPPLSLQRSFAAFVEKVEALKATAQASLARVDLLYRAKLQEYFG